MLKHMRIEFDEYEKDIIIFLARELLFIFCIMWCALENILLNLRAGAVTGLKILRLYDFLTMFICNIT